MEQVETISKITVFFDSINFLLTPYQTEADVHLVAEDVNGTQIHATGLNCGYQGSGPSATYAVFRFLGIPEEIASVTYRSRGFSINIPTITDYCSADWNNAVQEYLFFYSANDHVVKRKCFFQFDSFSKPDMARRRIMLYNPHIHHFEGMLHLIDTMQPYLFEFFIGSDSPLGDHYLFTKTELPIQRLNMRESIRGLKHINLIIRGERFDIFCLIDINVIASVVNVLHCYLFHEPYFKETNGLFLARHASNTNTIFSKVKCLYHFLFSKKKSIHEVIKIHSGGSNNASTH